MALDYGDFASFVSRMLSNAVHSLSVRLPRTTCFRRFPLDRVVQFPHQGSWIKKYRVIQGGRAASSNSTLS
jgi:hypothetical protein